MNLGPKEVVRLFIENCWTRGELSFLGQAVSPTCVVHDPTEREASRGLEPIRRRISRFRHAFPDLEFSIEDLFAEGDRVASRWSARGTHQGELWGHAPTGKVVHIQGTTVYRFRDGQIGEIWTNWDTYGLMRTIEALPQLDKAWSSS